MCPPVTPLCNSLSAKDGLWFKREILTSRMDSYLLESWGGKIGEGVREGKMEEVKRRKKKTKRINSGMGPCIRHEKTWEPVRRVQHYSILSLSPQNHLESSFRPEGRSTRGLGSTRRSRFYQIRCLGRTGYVNVSSSEVLL